MRQIPNCGDQRNQTFCVHCGGPPDTRDHSPSKVLLDDPLPLELPVLPACAACNNSFSMDEEYLACLIDCVLAGSAETADIRREKGRRLLSSSPLLTERFRKARHEQDGKVVFAIEADRIRRVLLKLARGHVAYEINEPQLGEPTLFEFAPLEGLSGDQLRRFETPPVSSVLPEVASRALFRFFEAGGCGWIVAQPGRYRYLVAQAGGQIIVRIVLSEYLASEVIWN